MTYENKKICREQIEKENWTRYGSPIDEEPSVLFWNNGKTLKIMFADMDGYPCVCRATYTHRDFQTPYFTGVDEGFNGNRMCNVFAFKEEKQ